MWEVAAQPGRRRRPGSVGADVPAAHRTSPGEEGGSVPQTHPAGEQIGSLPNLRLSNPTWLATIHTTDSYIHCKASPMVPLYVRTAAVVALRRLLDAFGDLEPLRFELGPLVGEGTQFGV